MSGINMDEDDSSNDAFVDYKTGLVDLLRKCSKLPKGLPFHPFKNHRSRTNSVTLSEWNVVQMTKMNNTFEAFATKKEISTQLRPIKFTLFRYVQSHKLNDKPITFHLEFVNSTNIFQSVFELYQEAYADREKRGAMYQKIETNLAVSVCAGGEGIGDWFLASRNSSRMWNCGWDHGSFCLAGKSRERKERLLRRRFSRWLMILRWNTSKNTRRWVWLELIYIT